MDFIGDLLVQLIAQIVVPLIGEILGDYAFNRFFRRAAYVLDTRVAQYVLSVVLALGFGVGWGQHLSGRAHRPKLLWVSIGVAVAAGLCALYRSRRRDRNDDDVQWVARWRTVFAPPWRWDEERLIGFALISVLIGAGIALGYQPSPRR